MDLDLRNRLNAISGAVAAFVCFTAFFTPMPLYVSGWVFLALGLNIGHALLIRAERQWNMERAVLERHVDAAVASAARSLHLLREREQEEHEQN